MNAARKANFKASFDKRYDEKALVSFCASVSIMRPMGSLC
jgi:hypothetical protein